MTADYQGACVRALAILTAKEAPKISDLFSRISWELLSITPNCVLDLALITRSGDGLESIYGARERLLMPRERISELVIEQGTRGDLPLVRDHLLNGSRFIEGEPRTSVVVRFPVERLLAINGYMYLWLGLGAVATSALVGEAESMAQNLRLWFESYASTVQSILLRADQRAKLEARERELLTALHDLKAPLSGIRNLIALGGQSMISEAAAIPDPSLDVIAAQVDYMERILRSLVPHSSSEAYQGIVSCNVNPLVQRLVERMRIASSGQASRLTLKLSEHTIMAAIPEIELERAVSNLLSNALRYAYSGEILVITYAQSAKACVRICDRGPGIPTEILSRLEDQGAQAVSSCSGWGIGLLSTRRRIESFQGELRISSSSSGATVDLFVPRVMLPIAEVAESAVGFACVSERVSPKLLLIDDEEAQILSLQKVLGTYGVSSKGCTSVLGALEALSLVKPEAILCDATMADGGVVELLNQIANRGIKARIAVASGDSSEELLYRCAALGAREFFSKPIDIAKLMQWIGCEDAEANAPTQIL